MSIIARYITKETAVNFIVITGILLLIVLSNRLGSYLSKVASGELPVGLAFQIVGFYIPELLSYLIPLGLFIGVLFAFGRLYADSEMIIFLACGIHLKTILKITLGFACIVALITAALTLWIVPEMGGFRQQALSKGESFGVMQSLLPQRFQMLSGGKMVFYLEDVLHDNNTLKGVFIAERPSDPHDLKEGWTLITAQSAHLKHDDNTHQFYMVLDKGYRYQGLPGQADYKVVQFESYGRVIMETEENTPTDVLRLKKTNHLWNSAQPEDAAELQWRLSFPISVLILTLIAFPLARVRPRQGRFAKLLPAIAIYIIYYNLFTVSRRWVAAQVLPSFIGVWWVHGLFLLVGVGLVVNALGFKKR